MASVKSALQKLPLLPGLITVLVVAVLTVLPVAGAAAGCQRILVKTSAETFLFLRLICSLKARLFLVKFSPD